VNGCRKGNISAREFDSHTNQELLYKNYITKQIKMEDTDFKKGDVVQYDNGKYQKTFTVYSVAEHHLYSTEYNIPSYSKKYCNKVS
jgi:hypothetical protein